MACAGIAAMMTTHRVFWNINAGPDSGQWIIDSGPGTPRVRVHHVICAAFGATAPPSVFAPERDPHPRAWLEISGKLTVDTNGIATISAFST
jgi:hypothetical protein